MISRMVMTAAMLIAVGGHPPPSESSPPPSPRPQPPVRLGPVLFPVEDSNTDASEVRPSHATVECGRSAEAEKHKSCNNHCRLLRGEYKGGECIEGRCHCKTEAEKLTCKESCPTHCKSLGREGLCVEGVCHCRDVELKCERHESCSSHCLTLGHTGSRCQDGICRCGVIAQNPEKRPTIKCSELASIGQKRRNRGELCSAHCRTLKEGYRRGECEKGVCLCSV